MPKMTTIHLAVFLAGLATQGAAEMTQQEVREGYREHAALAQYHRWYQFYERTSGGVKNALDILTEDVTVTSSLGTAKGHAQYSERVTQLPKTWENAHHVKSTEIVHGEDRSMTLKAQITYHNRGLLPDGATREADLTYTVELVPGSGVLPLLSEVKIEQKSEATVENFDDAYAENRMLSLMHYWLALIEDPSRDPDPVREILADEFSLNFSSGAVTTFEGFEDWLAGPGSKVAASTHTISNFSTEETDDGNYTLTVDFDWTGILPDGSEMVAKTRHDWTVENDVTERFARIKTINVEMLEDFRRRSQ